MTKSKGRKSGVRDPLAWISTRFPHAHMITSKERAALEIPELNCTWGQCCSSLNKCWLGFKIAKRRNESEGMEFYASKINNIQSLMGIPLTEFEI